MGLSALLHLLALVSRRGHLLLIVVLVLRGVGVELLSGSRIIIHGRALLTVMSALLELLVSVRIAHMPAKIYSVKERALKQKSDLLVLANCWPCRCCGL